MSFSQDLIEMALCAISQCPARINSDAKNKNEIRFVFYWGAIEEVTIGVTIREILEEMAGSE